MADVVAQTEDKERANAQRFLEDLAASRRAYAQTLVAETATVRQQAAEFAQSQSNVASSKIQEHAHVASVLRQKLHQFESEEQIALEHSQMLANEVISQKTRSEKIALDEESRLISELQNELNAE